MSGRLRTRLRTTTSLTSGGGGGGGPTAALDLNFAAGSYQFNGASYALQDIVRFSRTSAGTFYGSNGLVQNTAASKNLILWTEEFDNAVWVKGGASVPATQFAAPNGLLNADKLVEDTSATTTHNTYQLYTAANGVQTFSVYLKEGERRYATATIGNSTARYIALFDLQAGTFVTSYTNGTPTSTAYSITSVGSGWYRVSVTMNSASASKFAEIALSDSASPSVNIYGQPLYTGNGTSGVYMWGAQIEVASSATSYTRNADGLFAPRIDYDPSTLAVKGLLIEEQRTNLIPYSEQFDDASWTKFQASITANASASPDGTTTADKLVENSVSAVHEVKRNFTTVASTTYTMSVYLKADGRNWVFINFFNVGVADFRTFFNLSNGTVGTNPAGSTATITPVGNGWYRCAVTRTTAVGQTSTGINIGLADADNSPSYLGNGTSGVLVWGAQAELGSFTTAYIPTVASTVTRSADITTILLAAMSGLYNSAAGTLVVDVTTQLSNAANQFIGSLSDGSATNRASIFKTTAGIGGFRVTSGGTAANPTPPANALTGNVTHKVALALTTGTGNVMPAVNGTLGTATTLSTMPTGINVIRLGVNEAANADWLNGHIRRVRYFNTRLTDAELQAVTT